MAQMTTTDENDSLQADTVPAASTEYGLEGTTDQEQDTSKLPCAFFMRTGTCAYGNRCKFNHPADRPQVFMNSRGLPMRPHEPDCPFYVRHGWCAFADTCKFHHPELPDSPKTSSSSLQDSAQSQQRQQKHLQQGSKSSSGPQQRFPGPLSMPPHAMAPMGPYSAMGHMPGQPMMVPMGYYHPVMAPMPQHARMYPVAVSAPMIHPVMHMRPPFVSVPMGPSAVAALTHQMGGMSMNGTCYGRSSRGKQQNGPSSYNRGGSYYKGGGSSNSSRSATPSAAARQRSSAADAEAPRGEDQQ